jgi:hypothetical protein
VEDLTKHIFSDQSVKDWADNLASLDALCSSGHVIAVGSLINVAAGRLSLGSVEADSLDLGVTNGLLTVSERGKALIKKEALELLPRGDISSNNRLDPASAKATIDGITYVTEKVEVDNNVYKIIGLPETPGVAFPADSLDHWLKTKQARSL